MRCYSLQIFRLGVRCRNGSEYIAGEYVSTKADQQFKQHSKHRSTSAIPEFRSAQSTRHANLRIAGRSDQRGGSRRHALATRPTLGKAMTPTRSDSPPRIDEDLEVDAALKAPAGASMLDVKDASRTGYLSDTSSADVNLRTAVNGKPENKGRTSSISKGKAKQEEEEEEEDAPRSKAATVECMWESCGKKYTELSTLIEHLHSGAFLMKRLASDSLTTFVSADHIGTHKAKYTCEWVDCPRKGNMQTSRFALLSHLRSHTGEKPFTCPLPGSSLYLLFCR